MNSPAPMAKLTSVRTCGRRAYGGVVELDDVHEFGPASAFSVSSSSPSIHSWNVMPGGWVSVTPTTGILAARAMVDQMLHDLVGRLLVVEHHAHLVLLQVALEGGDVAGARLGVVHDRKLEFLVAHLQAERCRHVAEHRLAGGHRRAGIFFADGGDLVVERLERGEEGREPRLIVGGVRGIGLGERRGERLGDRRHGGGVVPQMRIVAGLSCARGRRRRSRCGPAAASPPAAWPSRDRSRRRCR